MAVLQLSVSQTAEAVWVVRLLGEVEPRSARCVEWLLGGQLARRPDGLIMDLSGVSVLGAAGAGALGRVVCRAGEAGVGVCLVLGAAPDTTKALWNAGMSELCQTCDTVEECCPGGVRDPAHWPQ